MLLSEMIAHNGRWRATHPAVIVGSETVAWQQFSMRIEQIAAGLAAEGLAGERIGIVMDNELAAVELIVGAMRAGAAVVPLNLSVADATLDTLLIDADIRALFASAGHVDRIGPDALRLARLKVVTGSCGDSGWLDYNAWREQHADTAAAPAPSGDNLCNIIYSSGTTGTPKGIAHSQRARADWTHDLAHALRYHSGARTLVTTGIYSNITWVSMLPTLMLGGTIVLHSGFDAAAVLEAFGSQGITHLSMVPIQLQRLVEHPEFEPRAFAALQSVMCCGSPLAAPLKAQLLELLPGAFFELYGSTEGIITTLAPEEAQAQLGSVGRPLPGEEMVILGPDDQPLAWGEVGEVAARSRFAMDGYWRRPDATADATWIDPGGQSWLRSGDIGRLDEAGYLTITDRKKDLIISGGQNIYPADIEAVLVTHPAIIDCAVIGIPSQRWGETPLALVVLRDGADYDPEEIQRWGNAQLGRQQRIGAIELRTDLARNPNGKLLKRELRSPYWPGNGQ